MCYLAEVGLRHGLFGLKHSPSLVIENSEAVYFCVPHGKVLSMASWLRT